MKMVDVDVEKPIKTGVPNQAYKEGWERTFGEKPTPRCTCPHQDAAEPAANHASECPAKYVVR